MTVDTGNAAYFSWDNLDELAGLEHHLGFAGEMIGKYQWEPGTRERFQRLLDRIREKQRDKQLNLSVIGEFSTGKSTLINALLRMELLASSALQGTTAACTVIEYGDRPGVKLTDQDGYTEVFTYETPEELSQALADFTTRPEQAIRLHSANVYLPAQALRAGFRIIDTPGTNALTQWHEEVTVRTIHEFSDLSIILVDATKPLPQSLCCFVEDNLSQVLHQCAFVVTKLSLIPERERDGMLAYITAKLKQDLELEDPLVLDYDALAVLRDAAGAARPEDAPLLQSAYRNESALLLHMKRQKALAQTKKVLALIGEMYQAIKGQLNGLSEKLEHDLAQLLRGRQQDLNTFVEGQKSVRLISLTAHARTIRGEVLDQLYYRAGQAQMEVIEELDSQKTLDDLKEFVDRRLADLCARGANQVMFTAQLSFPRMGELLGDEIAAFQREFTRSFHDLSVLDGAPTLSQTPPQPAVAIPTEGLSAAGLYVAQELAKENRAFWGGAAAGAAVGTAIIPGVGTLVGALLGGVGGSFFAPSCEAVKASSKEKLRMPMQSYFQDVVNRSAWALDCCVTQVRNTLPEELDRYLYAYQRTVSQRIAVEEEKRQSIERQIRTIQTDMDHIEQRKFQLDSLREQLDRTNRRES